MGEVATVAAIGGGILTSGITGLVTWKVSKNSAAVELAKVAAENERLQNGNREEERRNRQSTYHQFIDAATAVVQIFGVSIPVEERVRICDEYNHLLSGVLLFSPPSVREKAVALHDIYAGIWPALHKRREANPQMSEEDLWRDTPSDLTSDFQARGATLIELMHQDVTRGITLDLRN
jgi:hypothetical protein